MIFFSHNKPALGQQYFSLRASIIMNCKLAKSDVEERGEGREKKAGVSLVAD
jgi:hypothetical protein